jgi:hypothetical protein
LITRVPAESAVLALIFRSWFALSVVVAASRVLGTLTKTSEASKSVVTNRVNPKNWRNGLELAYPDSARRFGLSKNED